MVQKEQLVNLKHFVEHEGFLQGTVKQLYFNYFFKNLANWLCVKIPEAQTSQ